MTDHLQKRVELLERIIEGIYYKKHHEVLIDFYEGIHSGHFKYGQSYSNIIIVAGYAALFAIWSNVREFMDPNDMVFVALSLLLSVSSFVIWEIFKMLSFGMSSRNLDSALNEIRGIEDADKIHAIMRDVDINPARFSAGLWIFSFLISTSAGFTAIVILVHSYLKFLLG